MAETCEFWIAEGARCGKPARGVASEHAYNHQAACPGHAQLAYEAGWTVRMSDV